MFFFSDALPFFSLGLFMLFMIIAIGAWLSCFLSLLPSSALSMFSFLSKFFLYVSFGMQIHNVHCPVLNDFVLFLYFFHSRPIDSVYVYFLFTLKRKETTNGTKILITNHDSSIKENRVEWAQKLRPPTTRSLVHRFMVVLLRQFVSYWRCINISIVKAEPQKTPPSGALNFLGKKKDRQLKLKHFERPAVVGMQMLLAKIKSRAERRCSQFLNYRFGRVNDRSFRKLRDFRGRSLDMALLTAIPARFPFRTCLPFMNWLL